ncbi:endo alpha-1,4 polygalactosaminidase [Saccharospirillum salsuginis]|uniref:Endo alpha-1,4 polygalactosaminidase n=1 Tax=Saccharospirillum salsuginis TaxID=418750 RepID=A0A918K4B3_9GAMM|nr:endo alpha-1,4 polygalactosaminidase [Saccharospirillum salsuginis]GGX48424.1 endo alpha-1,4 polygalactosaminidase [Saccharospirillum salsuginis]
MPNRIGLLLPPLYLGLAISLSGCPLTLPGGTDPTDNAADRQRYQPALDVRWQWQLKGTINTDYDVELYDIDLFDTSSEQIAALQDAGRRVICYFSAGSYENWRPDAAQFNPESLGHTLDGWADERWLDVRDPSLEPIMKARLDLAAEKGCDGVEPDNVDGYANHTGFNLTGDDQLGFNRFLAREAHARGLAIALKNDLDQIEDLVDDFDFAINEECFAYNECEALTPFIEAGKPVLNVEYDWTLATDPEAREALCDRARQLNFRTLILPLELDDRFRFSC